MADLLVTVDAIELEATWTDETPETKAALADALPLEGNAVRWGDELYFGVSVNAPPENTQAVVPEGAIAYWSAGSKLCLFWGETPASVDGEPRAASPVTVVATLDETAPLEDVEGGTRVRLESAETR